MTTITADTLDNTIDFDRPFTLVNVGDDRATISFPEDVLEPDVSLAGNTGAFDVSSDKWNAVTGYSGQHGYSGPIMHASEVLGGRMAEDIIQDGGTYVVVEVRDEDGSYPEGAPLGWMLLVHRPNMFTFTDMAVDYSVDELDDLTDRKVAPEGIDGDRLAQIIRRRQGTARATLSEDNYADLNIVASLNVWGPDSVIR